MVNMSILIAASEWFTYLFVSILIGHVVFLFVPEGRKPTLIVSNNLLLASSLGLVFSSFGPVLQVVLYFYESVGVIGSLFAVMNDFQVGHAWLIISWVCLLMMLTILFKGSRYLKAFWLILIIGAVGYSSHVASLSIWSGWIAHSLHFLAVTLWAGVLIHVAWYSKEPLNWRGFVKWFSPFAAVCMLVILSTGFWVMSMVVEVKDYVNSWVLSYGQVLLLKHIVIIPLLLIAFSNVYLSRKDFYRPVKVVKLESLVFFLVIGCTAFLGILSPPHDIDFTVDSEGASSWAEYLSEEEIRTPIHLGLKIDNVIQGASLLGMAALSLGLLLYSIKKNQSNLLSMVFCFLFVISFYFGINRFFL